MAAWRKSVLATCALAVALLCAEAGAQTRVVISGADDRANIEAALAVIEGVAGELPDDAAEIRDLLAEVRQAFSPTERRVFKDTDANLGGKAATVDAGANPDIKLITLNETLFSRGAHDECDTRFIDLIGTLVHEGLHVTQATAWGPRDRSEVAEMEWKAQRGEQEGRARRLQIQVIDKVSDAIGQIQSNIEHGRPPTHNVPAWAHGFAACSPEELRALKTRITEVIRTKEAEIATIKLLLTNTALEPLLPDAMRDAMRKHLESLFKAAKMDVSKATDRELLDKLQQRVRSEGFLARHDGDRLGFYIDSLGPDATGGTVDGLEVPGVKFPQDALLLKDANGFPFLLVVGSNDFFEASGSVVLLPGDPTAVEPIPPPATGFDMTRFGFAAESHRTITASDPRIGHPTAVVRTSDGRILIWDPDTRGLYELLDLDGDLLPDTIDVADKVRIPTSARLRIGRRAEAHAVGAAIRLGFRAVVTLDYQDAEDVFLRDEDGDGFFERWEAVRPSRMAGIAPFILGAPIAGADFVEVAGVPGHRVELVDTRDDRVVDTRKIRPDGIVRLDARPSLASGGVLVARDLDNGTSSGERTVGTGSAAIYRMEPERLATTRSTRLVIHGPGVVQASAVRIGETTLVPRPQGLDAIFLDVPPRERGRPYIIVLEMPDGSLIQGPHRLFADDFE